MQSIKVYLAGMSLQVLIGLMQVLNGRPLGLPGELALPITQPQAAVVFVAERHWLRAYGLTFHPNVLGGYLAVGLLVGLALLKQWRWRLVWMWTGLGLLLTFSRSAWMATVVLLPPTAVWLARRVPNLRRGLGITIGVTAILGLSVSLLLAGPILTRLNPLRTVQEFTSISGRGELIVIAWGAIRSHPITGIGAGNFPLAMLSYPTLDPPHYVHHVPLLIAAEIGIWGAVLWYGLLAGSIVVLRRCKAQDPTWPAVLTTAWLGLTIIGWWDFYPWALESGRWLSITVLSWIGSLASSTPSQGAS